MSLNQSLFQYLNGLAGKSICFDTLVIFVAQYLTYWLVAGFVLFLIFSENKKTRIKVLFCVALSAFLARVIITEIIRYFYYVPRPFVNNSVLQLLFHETSGSFPSGHAAFLFALATAILFFQSARAGRIWSVLFFVGAVFICAARVIAGIHWPIDILAGAIVGASSAFIVKAITTRWSPNGGCKNGLNNLS